MLSPGPAAEYTYAAWQRMDCDAHSMARSASAPRVEGGAGAHTSSQISTWKTKSGTPLAAKTRSVPNGADWPASAIVRPTMPAPGANQRCS